MRYGKLVALWSSCLCAAALVVGSTPVAFAHDVVISSDPMDGATVAEFPRKISLEFSGIPQDSFNTIAVSNAATSEILVRTEPELNQQVVTLEIPDDVRPGPGDYIVGFQITSSDGHATRGKTTFSVGDPAASNEDGATMTQDATQTPSTSGQESEPAENTPAVSTVGWGVAGAALVLIVAVAAYMFKKRK